MAWQHPARPARHGTARHAAGRPFRPSGCRRAVENSGPGPAALTRSLFTEPVTSSSFRCRLNLGGMIPAGGGGREERLEVGYSPSAGCGPGRRQMAAATGAGLRHRAAPPSAERSTAGGGVACGWGRGLSVWAWSVGVGVVSGMPLGGGSRALPGLPCAAPTPRPGAPDVPQPGGNFPLPAPRAALPRAPRRSSTCFFRAPPPPQKRAMGDPPAWLPHDPELPKGTAGAAPPRGAVRGAPLAPGDGAAQCPPPRAAPGVPWGSPPPRPRPRLPAAALARGRANILASATARCRSFASGRHGGSTGIWKVPAAL